VIAPGGNGFEIVCSSGTYVRTIASDVGELLGCGAHLAELSRERQGIFRREEALPWDVLARADAADHIRRTAVTPIEALAFLPESTVPFAAEPLRVGVLLPEDTAPSDPGFVRLVGTTGTPLGIGRRTPDGLRPLYLFPPPAGFGRRARTS